MSHSSPFSPGEKGLRLRTFQIIFESDTRSGKVFDIVLISVIILSVSIVFLDSVPHLNAQYGEWFSIAEWVFTLIFTVEYALRIWCLDRPWRYMRSFYGIIDLVTIMPSWLSLVIPGAQTMLVIRIMRVLRLFRVLRLMEFVGEGRMLVQALNRSRRKILLFLTAVLSIITVFGSLIYLIEPPEAGFTSIPKALYWAIVTLTTVGYGDIAPITPVGQFISSIMMILGYSILAVPTGVFSAEVIRAMRTEQESEEACPGCGREGHDKDAHYCKDCGTWLDEETEDPRLKEDNVDQDK
ncbi:ion transporter [Larsenimonas rhizosphaerae]|uniref:Ion transporter n=1 Tax=Larsenimonas rhizosphaerae TaxID=2944682 RepID=A0AA41ZCD1_9GAMM|nr:ion transporter [Larsenimonas rhizosphaerae]MCX2522722.1 ion transporter [Larsenimonas rhizosphaerae]